MRLAPDNLMKEKFSVRGAGEGVVVEGAVGVPGSVGGDGAEETFFDRDATDRLFL